MMDGFLLFLMPPLLGLGVFYVRKHNIVQRIINGINQVKRNRR